MFFGPAGRTGCTHRGVGDFHLLFASRNAIDLPTIELLAATGTADTDAIGILGATQQHCHARCRVSAQRPDDDLCFIRIDDPRDLDDPVGGTWDGKRQHAVSLGLKVR